MEFADIVKKQAEKVKAVKDNIQTEEATKTSLIMPFFQQVLGYDIFDPTEFCPEYNADVGIKKGEKVDYAILVNGLPVILVEAKSCHEPLDNHASQLFRYFGTTVNAKIGILTNGIVYKFFSDLDNQNVMDMRPFLEVNLLNLKDSAVANLQKFHKEQFNIDKISSTADVLRYSSEIKNLLAAELSNPSADFIKYIISHIYDGRATQNIVDKFTPIIQKATTDYVAEMIAERIKLMSATVQPQEEPTPETDDNEQAEEKVSRINTTEEEIAAFYTIKSLVREALGDNNLTYKDTESYLGVLLNNNTRKWVCRLRVEGTRKTLAVPDENKNEVRHELNSIDDLYDYKDVLVEVIQRIIAQ